MAIWQVTLKQRWLGQEVRNVLHYEGAQESLTASEATELANDFRGDFTSTTGLVGALSNDWTLYGVAVRRVDEAGWPTVELGFTAGPLVGTNAAENLPTQVALLVHGTAYAQKPNRVRTYFGGMPETQSVDGLWSPAVQTLFLTFAAVLHSESIGGDLWERVAVEWSGDRTHVVAWNTIENYFVTPVPATQRRRRIGVGQ